MSFLLDQAALAQSDPEIALKNALNKTSSILDTTSNADGVKKELLLWSELASLPISRLNLNSPPDSSIGLESALNSDAIKRIQVIFRKTGMEKQVLSLILEKVLFSWSPAFTDLERSVLIHSWIFHSSALTVLHSLVDSFTKAISTAANPTLVSSASSASQRPSLRKPDSESTRIHVQQLCGLILLFFGMTPSQQDSQGIIKILNEISALPNAAQQPHVWTQTMNIISNIPTRAYNVLKRDTDPRFRPESYFGALTANLAKCLEKSETIPFPFYALWLGKMQAIGQIDGAIKAFDIANYASTTPEAGKVASNVLRQIPATAVEAVLLALFKSPSLAYNDKLSTSLTTLLKDLIEASSSARYVVTRKMFTTHSQPWWILRQLVDFLYQTTRRPLNKEWWAPTVETWVTTSGDAQFMKTSPYLVQRRLNRVLVYLFDKSYISKAEIEQSDLMLTLMATVQAQLNQTGEKFAFLGMRLGEAFSKIIDPANPLEFDGPANDADDEPDHPPLAPSVDEPSPTVDLQYAGTAMDAHDDYLDPEEDFLSFAERGGLPISATTASGASKPFRKGKFVQVDMHDDMSDTSDVKTPLYLRDAITALRIDEPKTLEAVMAVLAPLISSRPDDLSELAVSVCSTLLHVGNTYELDDFDKQKLDALVALVEYAPDRTIPHLCQQLYSANFSLVDRYIMLDALAQGSQNLAAHKVDPRPEFHPIALRQLSFAKVPIKNDKLITSQSDMDSKVAKPGKSRRWASEKKDVKTFQNRLAPQLPALLRILNYKEHAKGLALLMSDPRLLGKLIYTASVMVECAGPSNPDFESSTRAILATALAFRYHQDAFVVRAVVLAISAVIQHSPAWVLFEAQLTEMNELVVWLQQNSSHTDEEVRSLSTVVLIHLSRLYKDNPQYQQFSSDV